MTHYDTKQFKTIDTPLGSFCVTEKKWDADSPDEHWSVTQELSLPYDEDTPSWLIVGEILVRYTVAYELVNDGYRYNGMVDESAVLWVKEC